jgi:molybdate transport system regulatory protein
MASPKTKVLLRMRVMSGERIALGPGKADLLQAIAETGSISAAGRQLDMSYKRAWELVETMNRCFVKPLITASKGGRAGGGATLTAHGKRVLAHYRRMEARARRAVAAEMTALRRLIR